MAVPLDNLAKISTEELINILQNKLDDILDRIDTIPLDYKKESKIMQTIIKNNYTRGCAVLRATIACCISGDSRSLDFL